MSGALAVTGGLLLDGNGGRPLHDQVVLIEGDSIAQVGPAERISIPDGAQVIDAAGMTVMPGLINSNQHIQLNPLYPAPAANLPLELIKARWEHNWAHSADRAYWFLMQGITSMRNTSGPAAHLLPIKHAIERGELTGPRIWLGGGLFMSPQGFAAYARNTPSDAVEWLRSQFAYIVLDDPDRDTEPYVGADFSYWKLFMADDNFDGRNDYSDEQLRFIIDKAHRHGKAVDVHCTGNNTGLRRMLDFEIDTLEHPFYGTELIGTDVIDGYVHKGVIAASLLNVMIVGAQRAADPHRFDEALYFMSLDQREYRILLEYRDKMLANLRQPDQPGLAIYHPGQPPDAPDARPAASPGADHTIAYEEQQRRLRTSKENMRRFIKAGAKLSTGTDTNSFLNFMQEEPMANEMISMVEMGMSPLDVVTASTRTGAEALRQLGTLGTIESGKLADVIVVAGNPLQDMQAMKRVAYVVKGGVRFK